MTNIAKREKGFYFREFIFHAVSINSIFKSVGKFAEHSFYEVG
jgi:hypothetical protein